MIYTDNVLLFDLDGTVLNTDELIFQSFRYTFKKLLPDYTLSEEELLSFLGPPLRDSFARYLSGDQVDEAVQIFKELRKKHIIVRYFNAPRINQYLRVTIGNDEEMDAFLDAVKEIIQAS